jgi:hypothetical protein
MSALRQVPDIDDAVGDVGYGPEPDIQLLFDHLIGLRQHRRGHVEAERPRCPEIDN